MNRKEFREEVLRSAICPPDFDELYSCFENIQNDALKTLYAFCKVCEQNKIPYQLFFGSLLGAVRDGGQIPWDYDVDVIVPYEYKERLVKTLKVQLDDAYYFYCPEVCKGCRHFFLRVAPKKYSTEDLHVDVFYSIGLPEDNTKEEFEREILELIEKRYIKLVKLRSIPFVKEKVRLFLLKLKYMFLPLETINTNMNVLCNKYSGNDYSQCMIQQSIYKKLYFDKNVLWQTKLINIDGNDVRITENFENILQTIYGNYHRIFPLENRLSEMLYSYSLITGKKIKDVKISADRYYVQ